MSIEAGSMSRENNANQKALETLNETLTSLENSPAVKVAKLFIENTMGGDVIFTKETMDIILEHPDVRLYKAITEILGKNLKPE